MAIQLFMQSTILLSNYYGYTDIKYADVRVRARNAGLNSLPFMAPESVRATPELINLANKYEDDPSQLTAIISRMGGYRNLVKYYIRTGLRASQSICRNYLLDLDEKSEYLDFIEKEVGVGYTLSTAVLALVHANSTLTTSFLAARNGFDGALGAYQEYRFLSIDREAARAVVEAAQNQYAQYFLQQVDLTAENPNLVTGGYTFSDAIHAVSTIEYQCTRSGIKYLLARSINNSPSNLTIDPALGTVTFRSAQQEPRKTSEPGGTAGASGSTGSTGVSIPAGNTSGTSPADQSKAQSKKGADASGNQGALGGGKQSTNNAAQVCLTTEAAAGNDSQQKAQQVKCASDACKSLLSQTTAQARICDAIGKPNAGNTVSAFLSARAANTELWSKLPEKIGLAGLIAGTSDAFELARKAVADFK